MQVTWDNPELSLSDKVDTLGRQNTIKFNEVDFNNEFHMLSHNKLI